MSGVDILLVEDNPGDARLVEHYLENPSVRTFLGETSLTHVESLPDARNSLEAAALDVVLLDLGLPGSEGIETVQRVGELDAEIPVIVLTGLDDTAAAVEAIQSGAQDFLPKEDLDGDRLARSLRYAIERHKQERALARRNEQLDFFNSILRHDMQNGLNVVMGRARSLEEQLSDPDHVEQAAAITEWSREISDLAEKVRSILDTVADEDDISRKPVALAPVVAEQADRVDALADRVDVVVDVPEVRVLANDLLSDVVANVLTNAVNHTDDPVTVEVTCERMDGAARLRVADDGPGIPPDERDAVFERGQQSSASSGSGFGLYFVSSMVESYGGGVRVEESDRGGAAFVLELPSA